MRGFLKTRSAGNQLLLVICIIFVSLFITALAGRSIISAISGMSLAEIGDMSKWDLSKDSGIIAIRGFQIVQFIGVFLVPTLAATWFFSSRTKDYLLLRQPSQGGYWLAGILVMLLAIPLSNWLGEMNRNISFPSEIGTWMKESEQSANRTIKALLSRHTIKDLLLNIIIIAGLAAVGEELLFRGVLQRLFIRIFKNPWAGIIVAAALFSAVHMQFYGFFPRLLLGIILGAVFWFSGSLWVAIAAHFVYDALLIIAAWYRPELLNEGQSIEINNLAFAGAVSFVLVVLLIEWMRRKSKSTYAGMYAVEDAAINKPFQR
jgi:membrane protease YdiL (CAAX protease family)